jgi:methylenetetrahydrofolate dehydrogenase (NADP+)/methenyltetrahydrofolate cyclohydrolase
VSAAIIDGLAASARIKAEVAGRVAALKQATGSVPGLAAVIVGENPASRVYVRNKVRTAKELGIASFEHALPADVSEAGLLARVEALNADPAVSGILVQLPLPSHIDSAKVIAAIDPAKDVDGFHPVNAGKLAVGQLGFVPCTPLGCVDLIRTVRPSVEGLHAVVIGRSNIVGKPVAQLLLGLGCTVTIAHSKTQDLPAITRQADILVAAVGRADFVKADWVKPGAIVIDVGINRVPTPDGKGRLVGDVDYGAVSAVAGAITPVPGGVGPMTVAFLMANTCQAAFAQHGLSWQALV